MKFSRGLPLLLSPSIFPVTTMFSSSQNIEPACLTLHQLQRQAAARDMCSNSSPAEGIYILVGLSGVNAQHGSVACCDLGKVLFEYAVGCFGTSQLECVTRFRAFSTTLTFQIVV